MTGQPPAEQLDGIEVERRILAAAAAAADERWRDDPVAVAQHVVAAMTDRPIEEVRRMPGGDLVLSASQMMILIRAYFVGLDRVLAEAGGADGAGNNPDLTLPETSDLQAFFPNLSHTLQ